MDSAANDRMVEMLAEVGAWPGATRLAFAQRILRTLDSDRRSKAPPRKSLTNLIGLLATEGKAPSDQECGAILEEELLRKYGS